jgi:hypothetical protein
VISHEEFDGQSGLVGALTSDAGAPTGTLLRVSLGPGSCQVDDAALKELKLWLHIQQEPTVRLQLPLLVE